MKKEGRLHVILECFSFEMQYLIDDFVTDKMSWEKLVEAYDFIGSEQYDIREYRFILDHARRNYERIRLYAGVMPFPFALQAAKQGL